MLTPDLDQELDYLEGQLRELAVHLLENNAEHVQHSCTEVHALANGLAQTISRIPRTQAGRYRARLQSLAHELAVLREQLARRQAYVEQSVRLLIPAVAQETTYGAAKGLYAGANRPSGSLRALMA